MSFWRIFHILCILFHSNPWNSNLFKHVFTRVLSLQLVNCLHVWSAFIRWSSMNKWGACMAVTKLVWTVVILNGSEASWPLINSRALKMHKLLVWYHNVTVRKWASLTQVWRLTTVPCIGVMLAIGCYYGCEDLGVTKDQGDKTNDRTIIVHKYIW